MWAIYTGAGATPVVAAALCEVRLERLTAPRGTAIVIGTLTRVMKSLLVLAAAVDADVSPQARSGFAPAEWGPSR